MESKRKIIRSVHDGDTFTMILSQQSEKSWRQRVHEINETDGWAHYKVSANRRLDTLAIIAMDKNK